MKTFAIIGLGWFGSVVATELSFSDREVLTVDRQEDHVQRVAEKVTHVVAGDTRNPSVLRALGARNYDCAVVAAGDDIGNSTPITLDLKEIGAKRVICKVQSHVHHEVLEKIGADRVVFPEHEMGVELTQGPSSSSVLNFVELSEDFGIVETAIPKEWHYETIQNLDVRARHKIDIVVVRRDKDRVLNVAPGASYVIEPDDAVVALGRTEDINRFQDL